MGRRALITLAALALLSCGRNRQKTSQSVDAGEKRTAHGPDAAPSGALTPAHERIVRVACPVPARTDLDGLQERTASAFDRNEFAIALACAERGLHLFPRNVQAHNDRAIALASLRRHREAERAFTMALALDPDDPVTLGAAADFFVNHLDPDHDAAAIALEYARRASTILLREKGDPVTLAALAVSQARALDVLGRPQQALESIEAALRYDPISAGAQTERAMIQFHLCQFANAREAFEKLATQGDAVAHHHLGLLFERGKRAAEAERHFARAREIAPQVYFAPTEVPAARFRGLVDEVIRSLGPDTHRLLQSVTVRVEDLPELDDLLATQPPLPPTILGLYRGPPLGEPSDSQEPEARQIVLYRKNLQRISRTRAILIEQLRITLHHEIGHLLGEEDDQLHHRGLD